VEILRNAIEYIESLEDMLSSSRDPSTSGGNGGESGQNRGDNEPISVHNNGYVSHIPFALVKMTGSHRSPVTHNFTSLLSIGADDERRGLLPDSTSSVQRMSDQLLAVNR